MVEAFPEAVVEQAFRRAGARCECTRSGHGHPVRCPKRLQWELRGHDGPGGWEARPYDPARPATASNCEILCQPCYKAAT
ncbi:hypothetical protein U7230_13950 [Carboxydochorda subterranea]|uniref:HNH endonuclease n=1 Tax=Carboxydichorda subterranea TaxID=3109565 RepID=A0ABZ1BWJ3_9FIRM|nr:hypothetical protein [Limnochorda sp. L945t]WRP17169.1 hypothetical protein U7230_13950 [Limnochorda sp. L945t]